MKDNKIKNVLKYQVEIIDDILQRYTNDEAGEQQKKQYKKMSDLEKIKLLTITLLTANSMDDFENDLIINFDYKQYLYNNIDEWRQ